MFYIGKFLILLREILSIESILIFRWQHYFQTEKNDYIQHHKLFWNPDLHNKATIRLKCGFRMNDSQIETSNVLPDLVFTRCIKGNRVIYTHTDHIYHSMPETVEHKNIRFKNKDASTEDESIIDVVNEDGLVNNYSYKTRFL